MPGQAEWIVNALDRVKTLNHELARTSDLSRRAAIQERLNEAKAEESRAHETIKRDAAAGDPEARELLDLFEKLAARMKWCGPILPGKASADAPESEAAKAFVDLAGKLARKLAVLAEGAPQTADANITWVTSPN